VARPSTCKDLFLRDKMREEERIPVPDWLRSPEFVSFLPLLNLHHNLSRRLLSVCIIVLIVWISGFQWNVRENNMGGLWNSLKQETLHVDSLHGQILFLSSGLFQTPNTK